MGRQELLAKMRQRKDANKEKNEKKVKTVSTTGDREAPYDLEKVLKELGESSDTGKNSGKKSKDGGGPRARCSGGRKKSKNSKKENINANIDDAKETTPISS